MVLLPVGFLAGVATDVVHPDQLLGDLYQPFVSIAVGVILFEAGLRLSFGESRRRAPLVVRLVAVGRARHVARRRAGRGAALRRPRTTAWRC